MNQHGKKLYPRWRGEVLCDAHLVSNDGSALVETEETKPGSLVLRGALRNLTPLVQTVTHPPYGTFHYVFIDPDPEGATPPVAGGFLFLPPPKSPDFRLVTFNVGSLSGREYRRRCNEHHAEMQLRHWIRAQTQDWQRKIGCLVIQNGSRTPKLAYSPCNACADDMAKLLNWLDGLPRRPSRVKAAISWKDLYTGRPDCGHRLDRHGVELLVRAGWKASGPGAGGSQHEGRAGRPGPGLPRSGSGATGSEADHGLRRDHLCG